MFFFILLCVDIDKIKFIIFMKKLGKQIWVKNTIVKFKPINLKNLR